ncbi:hypothetical protein [Streptomyces sp. RFCAC02]|uniref:SecDF P1 head subdomain-containing protein n=1 Tax=Streptomyces sp. RFCAC02 TaxID=2499143 RepID=UPI001021ACE2|nr:hypothetical protein [Streptomyces sp. RFCAC02]
MSSGGASVPWQDRPGPAVPPPARGPFAGPPPPPPPPEPGRPRRHPWGPAALLAALVLTAAAVLFLVVRLTGSSGEDRAMDEPLRFVAVTGTTEGACAAPDDPATITADDPAECLTLDRDRSMTVARLEDARADYATDSGSGWVVDLVLLPEDARTFGDLTATIANSRLTDDAAPARLAIIQGGELLASPAVLDRIDGGEVVISGSFTRDEAEDLAGELSP